MFGPDSPVLIPTLNNTALLLRDSGDHARGIALAERAKALTDKTIGRTHPYYAMATNTLGEVLAAARRLDDARAQLDEALSIADKESSYLLKDILASRAKLASTEQQWDLAAQLAERAIGIYEAKVGKDAPDLWKPLTSLALAKINTGRAADARPLLERALAIGTKAKVYDAYLAPARDALAKLPPATD